jgi:hypothetical protein
MQEKGGNESAMVHDQTHSHNLGGHIMKAQQPHAPRCEQRSVRVNGETKYGVAVAVLNAKTRLRRQVPHAPCAVKAAMGE